MKKIIAILLVLLLTAGCQRANIDTTPQAEAPQSASESAETEVPQTAVPEETAAPETEAPETEAPQAEAIQYAFSFSAKTLDGEKVTQEYFGQYDLTMVNVWASWCGPCKSELAELGQLYGKLPENVGFLSITVDDPQDLKEAKALLEENGCTFPCLDAQSSSGLFKNFLGKVTAIPTTVFFDRSGNEVGGWLLGVPQGGGSVSDAYLKQIQNRLDQLNGK